MRVEDEVDQLEQKRGRRQSIGRLSAFLQLGCRLLEDLRAAIARMQSELRLANRPWDLFKGSMKTHRVLSGERRAEKQIGKPEVLTSSESEIANVTAWIS